LEGGGGGKYIKTLKFEKVGGCMTLPASLVALPLIVTWAEEGKAG